MPVEVGLLPEQVCEIRQLRRVQVRHDAVTQPVKVSINDGVTAAIFGGWRGRCFGRPDEDVNRVLVSFVDECGDGVAIQIIEAAADQREALRGKILNVRREIDFTVEPGLDGVLVTGDDVGEVPGHERADVAGNGFVSELIAGRNSGGAKYKSEDGEAEGAKGQPLPEPGAGIARSFFLGTCANVFPETCAERLGSAEGEIGIVQRRAERLERLAAGCARGAGFQMLFDIEAADEIEFTIEVGVQERMGFGTVHFSISPFRTR